MDWRTIYICLDCGKVGIRPNDKEAGKYHLLCPGCGKLKSRSSFKKENRLMGDYSFVKTRFTKKEDKQLTLS